MSWVSWLCVSGSIFVALAFGVVVGATFGIPVFGFSLFIGIGSAFFLGAIGVGIYNAGVKKGQRR